MSISEVNQLYKPKSTDIQAIIDELDIGKNIEERTNPFSGESIELNPTEVALYDYLVGCEIMNNFKDSDVIKDWFLKNNSKAYMTLLD
jgi:hypothetical protein